jgi:hypothetical protein
VNVKVGGAVGGMSVRVGRGVSTISGGVDVSACEVAAEAAPAVMAMMVGTRSSGKSVGAGALVGAQPAKSPARVRRSIFRSMVPFIPHSGENCAFF